MSSQHNQNKNRDFQMVRKPNKRIADKMCGNLCIFYLLLMLAFLSWQLFDTWISRHFLLRQIGYGLQSPQTLRLIAFTVIAGALGAVVNGLRSSLHYHDRFDRRHAWKYLCAPWMGATLALFVYALLRSSVTVLSGDAAGSVSNTQVISNFSVGALVGYGSKDVFIWLDHKVTNLFHVALEAKTVKTKKSRSLAKTRVGNGAVNHKANVEPLPHHDSIPVTMSAIGKPN